MREGRGRENRLSALAFAALRANSSGFSPGRGRGSAFSGGEKAKKEMPSVFSSSFRRGETEARIHGA